MVYIEKKKMMKLQSRHFAKSVTSVILDWSGTTVDPHVLAPAVVFCDVFKKHGVPISMEEARFPMGLRKDLHIKKILEDVNVRERWERKYGKYPDDNDVSVMFKDFVPMQLGCLSKYTGLIDGVTETVKKLRDNYEIKIGTTTGFTAEMVDIILEDVKKQGYEPDSSVAGDQVEKNLGVRPLPYMVYKNMMNLGESCIQSVVKVDDTVSGVGEGLNAGCWAVGIYGLSNYTCADSIEEWESLGDFERNLRVEQSRNILCRSGAHYVIDNITRLPLVVDDINRRLVEGERP